MEKKIRQTDHHKEYMAEYFKEYRNNPKYKEAQKRYQQIINKNKIFGSFNWILIDDELKDTKYENNKKYQC